MIRFGVEFDKGFVRQFERFLRERAKRATLVATDRLSREALKDIRSGLGRLGGALKQFSDRQKGGVFRRGSDNFSASGGLAIRTRNERIVGAIISATEGAEILPIRGRYLWIATDEIPKRAGRRKMTPELYVKAGLDRRIGPLVLVRNVNGGPLLVVKDASVDAAGRPNRAKARLKRGGLRKGQRAKGFIVAFIGIRQTRRTRTVDALPIVKAAAGQLGEYINTELQKGS